MEEEEEEEEDEIAISSSNNVENKDLQNESDIEIFFGNLRKYPNNQCLNNSKFKELLDQSWKKLPRLIYFVLLSTYCLFLCFYSIYIIELKKSSFLWKSWSGIMLIIFLIINIIFEVWQFIDSWYNNIFRYIFSWKNIMEILTFILAIFSILLGYNQTNLILCSVVIVLAYSVLIFKLDKFYHLGKYVQVIGKIFRKANGFVIIVLVFLIAFCLSFWNLSQNFSNNQDDYISSFNSSFGIGFFKTIIMMIGSLETEDMGLDNFNNFSFINFIIYGFFIYFMSILLLNIFTGISIDEVQTLFRTAEKDDAICKLDYILKIEQLKKKSFPIGKLLSLGDQFLNFVKNIEKDLAKRLDKFKIFKIIKKQYNEYLEEKLELKRKSDDRNNENAKKQE